MSSVVGSRLMSAFNFKSKYARYLSDSLRRETWIESNDRMFNMHLDRYRDLLSYDDLVDLANVAQEVKDKKLLGSQRALQFGGKGVESHNLRIYNCAVSYCDRPRFFAECFYMLLCGCGTGFSVQKHHVAQLPDLAVHRAGVLHPEFTYPYVIEDSIEGWADSLNVLVNFYLQVLDEYGLVHDEARPEFDFSQIRERGAPLSVGGTAPGPEPLRRALQKIEIIFQRCIANGQTQLRPIDAYDIIMHAADAVLSGGVRRSATIAVFSPDDEDMIYAKTGNWYLENKQRARSNNSAALVRNQDNLENFKVLMKAVREFGEPGFIFLSSTEHLYNPCVEVGMCPILIRDPNGNIVDEYTLDLVDFSKRSEHVAKGYTFVSGWQCCNLTELNASLWTTREEALRAARSGAILGTLQAGYTDPGYLLPESQLIIEREALLGVSMTGMMDNPDFAFDPELQRDMAKVVLETNAIWAKKIGINSAARGTCVKPAGNSTVILSDKYLLASGINPHKTSSRMLRRVQIHKDDPVGIWFEKFNPHMIEESVWSANQTDNVITFPITIREGALSIDDMDAVEFLEYVRSTQQNWVISGTARPMSCEGLTHNVSNTCDVKPEEWSDVGRYIYNNRDSFSGLSLLGRSGDYMYRQAPMQRIVFESELADMFGSSNVGAAKHLKRHIERRYGEVHNVMTPLKMVLEGYTTEEAVAGTNIHPELLWDTYKRIRAIIHVEDADNILMLLASIGHEEYWNYLTKNMIDVDYMGLVESTDLTKAMDAVACAGGLCDLDFSISDKKGS